MLIVRRYEDTEDIEVAGIVAAALALGNAAAIMGAASTVLGPLGKHPAQALASMDDQEIANSIAGFRYRFFDEVDLAAFLCAVRSVRAASGSLQQAFLEGDDPAEPDYAPAASRFVHALVTAGYGNRHRTKGPSSETDTAATGRTPPWRSNLFPDPARGSAAKRVFLYLRWMVRKDAVDPGPWTSADPARLVVPLDTHMAAACRRIGLIDRRSTDLKAAREAGAAFRTIRPDDPVRYDFCMTRPGIHPDLDPDECFDPFR